MAFDLKYGHVSVENQPGSRLGDDEPVIVFRAQDTLLLPLLARYENLYSNTQPDGFKPEDSEFVQGVRQVCAAVAEWQAQYRDKVKLPD